MFLSFIVLRENEYSLMFNLLCSFSRITLYILVLLRACVLACVRACVLACVLACVRACVHCIVSKRNAIISMVITISYHCV